jgi:drug/metabolite transporter (DMT)-like permease
MAALTASTRPSRPLLGILFMCMACALFPVMNGLVTILSDRYPSEQLVWARQGSHLIVIAALFAPSAGLALFKTNQLKWQILRSIVMLASTLCFFFGVKYLPLAKANSISFTGPFIVTILARVLLGERISLQRMAAIFVGVLGVVIVIRPGSDVFQWASLFILGSAFFYSLYQVLTRFVGGQDRAETSAFYGGLVGTIVLSFYMPFTWTPVVSWQDGALMFSLGILGGLGHYCVARALVYAQASVVAPFLYSQMIGSLIVGYFVSGYVPDRVTWIGIFVIVAAGLYAGWRESREKAPGPAGS